MAAATSTLVCWEAELEISWTCPHCQHRNHSDPLLWTHDRQPVVNCYRCRRPVQVAAPGFREYGQ